MENDAKNLLLGQKVLKAGFKLIDGSEIKHLLGYEQYREIQRNLAIERLKAKHGDNIQINCHKNSVEAEKEITIDLIFGLFKYKKQVKYYEQFFNPLVYQSSLNLYCRGIIPDKEYKEIERAKAAGIKKIFVRYMCFEGKLISTAVIGYITNTDLEDDDIEIEEDSEDYSKRMNDTECEDYIGEEMYLFEITKWENKNEH